MKSESQKGAVSKCKLQENSPLQKLDKAVKIQFISNFHSFLSNQNALGRLHLLTAAVMRSAVVTATPQISAAN